MNGTNIENNIPLRENKMDNPVYMDSNAVQNSTVPPINSQYTATVKSKFHTIFNERVIRIVHNQL